MLVFRLVSGLVFGLVFVVVAQGAVVVDNLDCEVVDDSQVDTDNSRLDICFGCSKVLADLARGLHGPLQ